MFGNNRRSFVDWLAVAASFGLFRGKRAPKWETPREMLERLAGRKLDRPKPRPPVGGMRRDQVQRRRKAERKRKGPNYSKEARHNSARAHEFHRWGPPDHVAAELEARARARRAAA